MLDLSSFKKAVRSLKVALAVAFDNQQIAQSSDDIKKTVRAGVIQNFEFTYELCWKFMKRWLENNVGSAYVDGLSRYELFRLAAEHHLIGNVEKWIAYHDLRNETSHIYEEATAEEMLEAAVGFAEDAEGLLANLEKKNA
jgi:nucleotidyltransferase substrate binding protein (TIGR01987 family)